MNFNQNRLRFVHCEHLFSNFQEITEYVRSVQYERASLYAEPMIFKYGDEKNPCIVLAIGSVGEGKFEYDTENGEVLNKTYYIDFSQAERDIEELYKEVGENRAEIERIDGIVKNMITACGFNEEGKYVPELDDHILGDATSLFVADKLLSEYIIALEKRHELYVKDTASIDLTVEKGDTGVTLSSDVKLGTKIYEGQVIDNIIIEQEDGIFTSVDLDYSEEESKLTLTINGDQKKDIPLPVEAHVIKGEYDSYNEKLILTLNNAVEIEGVINNVVEINMAKLIDEWDVLGEASETPIVLTKEHVKSIDSEHEGMYDYQDILKADVRILDKTKMPDNILSKDSSGKFLYVEGAAANISYIRNNEKINVQQGIDEKLSKTDISQRGENTINLVNDGIYSFVDLGYDVKGNKLIFQRSNPKGEIIKSEYVLNSVQLIQKAYFDPTTEDIVISYIDATGEYQELRIPLQIVVNELDVDNTNATVTLTIVRNPQGQDTIKGNVNIAEIGDNILENVSHSLYVRGTADNIKMIDKTLGVTVEAAILGLDKKVDYLVDTEIKDRETAINDVLSQLNSEIERAKEAERLLQDNLDAETRRSIAAEEELTRNLNSEVLRATSAEDSLQSQLNAEIDRAKSAEEVLKNSLDAEIQRSTDEDVSLNAKLTAEIERAKAAEHTNKVDIINEYERATLKESELERILEHEVERSTRIDGELTTKLDNEIERATTTEDDINNRLVEEIARAKDTEQALRDTIKDEENRAIYAEHVLEDAIKSEESRAISAEQIITDNLNTEIGRAMVAEKQLEDAIKNEVERAKATEQTLDEKIISEINRSINKDNEIVANLEQAKLDLSYVVKNSGTIDLTKNIEEIGSSIIGKVNVSTEAGNIINTNGEPLYATVDIIYNPKENVLTLTRSGLVDKEIKLNEGSLIESIVYDDVTKELVITYYDSYGNERQERVNVADLFNQWVVETNHLGAVQLTKELNYDGNGTDKLIAEVVVSELRSNLLVNDKGSLYVSNSAKDILMDNNTSVLENIHKLKEADASLANAIKDEENRAITAEKVLQSNLDLETSRAIGKETELNTLINNNSLNLANEINRALAAENELRNDIDEETARAIAADDTLRGLISSETERAAKEEARLESLINTEIGRAQTVEANLSKDIESVKNTANQNAEKIDETIVQVEEIVKTYAMSVKDTATVDLTKEVIDASGFIVSADVKLSTNDDNQIIKYEDGLYTNVILTYSENNNTLHFTTNGKTVDIPLTSVSTIDKINYLPDTNEIEIVYVSNGEIQRVTFPASGMFKPITTNNDNTNVVLKEITNAEGATELSANLRFVDNVNNDNTPITLYATEDNKLKAKLNIADSAAANNILEITSDGSGIWVNGVATNIEMVVKQLGWGNEEFPFHEADDVEEAIHYLDGTITELRKDFEAYVDEDLVNSMVKDINNLKTKTDINAITTPGIDLTFKSTESESSLKANVIVSDDPRNLLKVYSDTFNEFVAGSAHPSDGSGNFLDDTYNGVLFDGSIDYSTFSHKDVYSGGTDHFTDWTRHLQIKRDDVIFENKEEALAFLYDPNFLIDKKDGEPLLARYTNTNENGEEEVSFILGFVRVVDGQKTIQTLDNKGTLINRLEYIPNATQIITKDAFGKETVTNVTPESLYLEYTDSSSLKHTIVTPLKELVEEYLYPESKATTDGKVVTEEEIGYKVDGVDNAKEILDENNQPIYVETTVRQFHNVNFDIERNEDNKSIIKADVDYYDCGEYEGEDYIKK